MPKTLEELRARRDEIEARLKEINTEAGENDLTDEQATEWRTLETEHEELRGQIEDAERRTQIAESRRKWSTVQVGATVTPFDGEDVRSLRPAEARDRSRKLLDTKGYGDHLDDRQKRHVEKVLHTRNAQCDGDWIARLMLATERDEYRSAFQKAMLYGPQAMFTSEEARAVQAVQEIRAMSHTPASGGYGVPVLIDPTITLTAQGSPNDILSLARVVTITTDAWKGVSSAGVSWRFGAEASEASDNSPTLAQPTVNVHKADVYVPYSIEIEGDYPAFAAEMSRLINSGYRELLAQKLTVGAGDGSNEPYGIVTALDANTNVEKAVTTAGSIGEVDLYDLWAALPIRYRANAAWMSSTDVQNAVRALGNSGDASFTVNLTQTAIPALFGRTYPANDYMDALPSGTNAGNLLIVGDWENYLVAQRAGMSLEQLPHVIGLTNNRPTGERAWYGWARVGADSINDDGFRLLQNKTS